MVSVTWLFPVTVKLLTVVALPAGVESVIGPVNALLGTAAVTSAKDVVRGAVGVPPPKSNDVTLERLVPVIVTTVLGGPMTGEKPKIFGKIAKELELMMMPPGVVMVMEPATAFVGTLATICVAEALKL